MKLTITGKNKEGFYAIPSDLIFKKGKNKGKLKYGVKKSFKLLNEEMYKLFDSFY